jgi:cytidine deaminase
MTEHQVAFSYKKHSDPTQLVVRDQELIQYALETCEQAYAPYSNFRVGVAIRTVNDFVVVGSNQENGAYPIGQCAERVALYRMTHEVGREVIDTIAIAVDNAHQLQPASPCGSCRQMLAEYRSFQQSPIRLLLTSKLSTEVIEINDITDLLPMAFDGKFLGQ